MIGQIKRKYRQYKEEQYKAGYEARLEQKTKTYDKWIREREEVDDIPPEKEGIPIHQITGEFVFFSKDRKGIRSSSFMHVSRVFEINPRIQVVYGDEDEFNSNEKVRMNPWLKPDYSPETLLSYFYFGNCVAIRKSLLKESKFYDKLKKEVENEKISVVTYEEIGKENLYEFLLKLCFSLHREQIYHLKKIIYTSRDISPWGYESRYDKCKEEAVKLRKKEEIQGVSIIIPSKDNVTVLRRCLESIVRLTKGITYELILVDNGSREENRQELLRMKEEIGFQYHYQPMEFNFSKMCNLGAGLASYNFYLFLNDDCEVRVEDWLLRMTNLARLKTVGAVGTKLYYPESKKIQHCGVYQIHMGPAHKLQFHEDDKVYYDRRNVGIRNVLAVTAACLMVRKDVYEAAGGFDESLQVAFNDVDFCYTIYELGYDNVIDNETYLWHHESLSRGSDDSEEKQLRFRGEKLRLYEKHPKLWKEDPYYHPGFTLPILDTGYSFSYEYQPEEYPVIQPVKKRGFPIKIREDECVAPLIEYSGNLKEWFLEEEKIQELRKRFGLKEPAYLQGSIVVIGSDNSYFEKYLILCQERTGIYYEVSLPECYRPDIFRNLLDQKNVGLSGFSCFLEMEKMEPGTYQIYAMVKDQISGQYILRKTTRKVTR